MNSKTIASLIHSACEEKQGENPVVLDVRKLTTIADYFVVVHGNSDRHVRTLADYVTEALGRRGVNSLHAEGLSGGKWVLLDYGVVIAHIFYYETRKFYNLERLWGDAKVIQTVARNERKTKRTRRSSPSRSSK